MFSPTRFHFQLKKHWDKVDTLATVMNIFYSRYPYLYELRVPPNQLRVGVMFAVVWEEDDLLNLVRLRIASPSKKNCPLKREANTI